MVGKNTGFQELIIDRGLSYIISIKINQFIIITQMWSLRAFVTVRIGAYEFCFAYMQGYK